MPVRNQKARSRRQSVPDTRETENILGNCVLVPGPRGSSPPPLYELPEDEFEKLCRDLMAREPTVSEARLFRTRGHAQLGIDILCSRRHDDGSEVAQCKRYRAFGRDKIRGASDDFLEHLSYWRERDVRRFVLIVTDSLQGTGQDDQIGIEKKRFTAAGIRYEAWSLETIVQRLRPWPDIVARAFGHHSDYWVEKICGRSLVPFVNAPSTRRRSLVADAAAETQFTELIGLAAAGVAAQLAEIRTVARRGLIAEASARLATMQTGSGLWNRLPEDLRARALRLRASLALDSATDVVEAKRLNAEADEIDPNPSLRLQAQIVLEEQGPVAAREFLDGCGLPDDDLVRLAAVCHLRTGEPQLAVARLQSLPDDRTDPETRRLLALALMALSRSDEAIGQIRQAFAAEPDGWAMRMTLGILLYLSALAPMAARGRIAAWPEPCDWALVRRDDTAVSRLREAGDIFAALRVDKQERVDRETLEGWQLACLANDAERRNVAEEYCRDVLRSNPTHPPAILWSIARAFPTEGDVTVLDVPRSRRALEDLLDAGRGEVTHLATLATILGLEGKSSKVRKLLNKHARLFVGSGTSEYRRALLAETAIRSRDKAPDDDFGSLDPHRLGMLTAIHEPDRDRARPLLVDLARMCKDDGGADAVLSDILFRLAYLRHVEDVAPYSDWLVAAIGTADAVRLAAHAKASVHDDAAALAILDKNGGAFPGGALTRDLRMLHAQCHQRLGHLSIAIAELAELNEDPLGIEETLGLADLLVRRGDLGAASKTLSRVASDPRLAPEHALRFAKLLSHHHPSLARILWDRAVASEIQANWLPTAFEVAQRLAVGPEAAFIVERMAAHAVPISDSVVDSAFVSLSTDELLSFLRDRHLEMQRLANLYARGEVPLHILAPQMGLSFARIYHADLQGREKRDGTGGFLPAAYGGRSMAVPFPPNSSACRMHMDVSAVLLAAHLGILDAVERCFRPIHVSSYLVPALMLMRDHALDHDPEENVAAAGVLAAARSGRLSVIGPADSDEDMTASEGELLRLAVEQGGAAVFWDVPASEVPGRSGPMVNLSGLVAILEASQAITIAEAAEARARLGVTGRQEPITLSLERGSPVFFLANTIQSLAETGILAAVCGEFHVYAQSAWLKHVEAQQRARAANEEIGAWISAIIQRLNLGIQDGTYELLPDRPLAPEVPGTAGELLVCLLDLFRIPLQPGNMVWVDDRRINAYANCGTATLVGIMDVPGCTAKVWQAGRSGVFRKAAEA